MQPAVLIRLRPTGPWRYGPGEGGHDRVDTLYRSDRVYSALTIAMRQLGVLEEWLDATARSSTPALACTSLFPFQGDALFVLPPATLWPPPASLVTTPSPVFLAKMRWEAAQFVPLSLVESILTGQSVLADQWIPDAESGCLLRRDRPSSSPFRIVNRSRAAVDRVTRASAAVHTSACIEFESGAGLWAVVRFADEAGAAMWKERVRAAFRLLADSGFGGSRSSGWGQTEAPEFQEGAWPGILMPKLARLAARAAQNGASDAEEPSSYWLLSLFSPATTDVVDWTGGDYRLTIRGGHIERAGRNGAEKKRARMISEGSVLAAQAEPSGTAVDVAPEGFEHPVYRSGFAIAVKLPKIPEAPEQTIVEPPTDIEALEPKPCEEARPAIPEEAVVPDDSLEAASAPESETEEDLAVRLVEPEQAVRELPEEAPQADKSQTEPPEAKTPEEQALTTEAAEEAPEEPEATAQPQEPASSESSGEPGEPSHEV